MSDLSTLDELPIINPDELTDWPAFTKAPGVEMVYRFDSMSDLLYNLNAKTKEANALGLIVSVHQDGNYFWFVANAAPAEAPAIAT